MKKLIVILCVLTYFSGKAQFVKAELQASGLTCSMCSFATQKQLKTLDFIDSIGSDLDHTTFMLYFKPGTAVDLDQIKKKVEDAGFSVASLKITYHFDNVKIENDHFVYEKKLYHFVNSKPRIIDGSMTFKVIDKGFLSDKEYKKYLKANAQSHNQPEKTPDVSRIYHVIVL